MQVSDDSHLSHVAKIQLLLAVQLAVLQSSRKEGNNILTLCSSGDETLFCLGFVGGYLSTLNNCISVWFK